MTARAHRTPTTAFFALSSIHCLRVVQTWPIRLFYRCCLTVILSLFIKTSWLHASPPILVFPIWVRDQNTTNSLMWLILTCSFALHIRFIENGVTHIRNSLLLGLIKAYLEASAVVSRLWPILRLDRWWHGSFILLLNRLRLFYRPLRSLPDSWLSKWTSLRIFNDFLHQFRWTHLRLCLIISVESPDSLDLTLNVI